MRFGYWMPIFGGWLRNVTDEGMPVSWPYIRDLAAESEQLGFEHPVIGRYLEFAAAHGIGIAGFEFIETADGRLVTYDINTTTNYNAEIEAVAPRPALPAVAGYLGGLLAQTCR